MTHTFEGSHTIIDNILDSLVQEPSDNILTTEQELEWDQDPQN
jgi:hypothetical protein